MSAPPGAPGAAGLVGVGHMGGAMAENLLARGWRVAVCDLDAAKVQRLQEKGADPSANPSDVAIKNDVTIVCVVDAAQTEDVLFGAHGLAHGARAGHTVLLCPTIAPDDVERFAARLAAHGIHTLDAPMSGGPARAREGRMSLMVAGARPVVVAQHGLLHALADPVFLVGERVGDGARTKLVNNLLAGIQLVGAAEALALAERLGLDAARTLDVIERSSGQSWIGTDRMRRALAGDTAPRAYVTLLAKDTRLAVAAARAAGFIGPLGPAATAVFARAVAAGLAEQDDSALLQLLRGG